MKVLLGVTGGIAAYKAPEIVRRLADQGAQIQVAMTASACEFVQPLVFQAVSGNAVHTELLDEQAEAGMGHIELARWADIVLIAPATANSIARLAAGIADDLLSTICLATRSTLVIAPAMNSAMWDHAATQHNVATLKKRGVVVLGPGTGSQACGETGAGRLLEPMEIVKALPLLLGPHETLADGMENELAGTNVLITAGPTREDIDPVRFISNHSSGKMGFALATAAQLAGASVTLVAGPVRLDTPVNVSRIDVVSAMQMHEEVMARAAGQDIFISVAAVADYRVVKTSDHKIKKSADELTLSLTPNPDILADVASLGRKPFCMGFAAETSKLEEYARGKLKKKNLDMIVGNLVGGSETGFNSDQNAVEVYWPDGHVSFSARSKSSLAKELVSLLASHYSKSNEA